MCPSAEIKDYLTDNYFAEQLDFSHYTVRNFFLYLLDLSNILTAYKVVHLYNVRRVINHTLDFQTWQHIWSHMYVYIF